MTAEQAITVHAYHRRCLQNSLWMWLHSGPATDLALEPRLEQKSFCMQELNFAPSQPRNHHSSGSSATNKLTPKDSPVDKDQLAEAATLWTGVLVVIRCSRSANTQSQFKTAFARD